MSCTRQRVALAADGQPWLSRHAAIVKPRSHCFTATSAVRPNAPPNVASLLAARLTVRLTKCPRGCAQVLAVNRHKICRSIVYPHARLLPLKTRGLIEWLKGVL
jgi:hypothetical protein